MACVAVTDHGHYVALSRTSTVLWVDKQLVRPLRDALQDGRSLQTERLQVWRGPNGIMVREEWFEFAHQPGDGLGRKRDTQLVLEPESLEAVVAGLTAILIERGEVVAAEAEEQL